MIKIGAKQDQRLIKINSKHLKQPTKHGTAADPPLPSRQLSPRVCLRQPVGSVTPTRTNWSTPRGTRGPRRQDAFASLTETNGVATRGVTALASRDCSARWTADRWRGFILSVHLIKLFNPTADIKSCWLYIRVDFGTLGDTENTPKNSKNSGDGPRLWGTRENSQR